MDGIAGAVAETAGGVVAAAAAADGTGGKKITEPKNYWVWNETE